MVRVAPPVEVPPGKLVTLVRSRSGELEHLENIRVYLWWLRACASQVPCEGKSCQGVRHQLQKPHCSSQAVQCARAHPSQKHPASKPHRQHGGRSMPDVPTSNEQEVCSPQACAIQLVIPRGEVRPRGWPAVCKPPSTPGSQLRISLTRQYHHHHDKI